MDCTGQVSHRETEISDLLPQTGNRLFALLTLLHSSPPSHTHTHTYTHTHTHTHTHTRTRTQLEEVKWRLNLQMAQSSRSKMKTPNALFEFVVKEGKVSVGEIKRVVQHLFTTHITCTYHTHIPTKHTHNTCIYTHIYIYHTHTHTHRTKIKSDLTSHTRSCIPSTLRYTSLPGPYYYSVTRNCNHSM